MPKLREQVEQVRETQQEIETIRDHIHRHKNAYLLGVGFVSGALATHLFASSKVVVVTTVVKEG